MSATEATSMRIVDCRVRPVIPYQWSLKEHTPGDKIDLDKVKVLPHAFEGQDSVYEEGEKKGRPSFLCQQVIEGLKTLEGRKPANANLMDAYLEHPDWMPPELIEGAQEGDRLIFWDTVFTLTSGKKDVVRCLLWKKGAYRPSFLVIDRELVRGYAAKERQDGMRYRAVVIAA